MLLEIVNVETRTCGTFARFDDENKFVKLTAPLARSQLGIKII